MLTDDPVVSGVTASQRTGTKIVDATYNLAMDGGQTAFVELWFSPDNGLNFPIRCVGQRLGRCQRLGRGKNRDLERRIGLGSAIHPKRKNP